MQGMGAGFPQGRRQPIQVVLQRFTAGDHREGGSVSLGLFNISGEGPQAALGVSVHRPGVLGVTPGTPHIAASQTDEKGTAAAVVAFPLQGMEGLHHRQGGRVLIHRWV